MHQNSLTFENVRVIGRLKDRNLEEMDEIKLFFMTRVNLSVVAIMHEGFLDFQGH